MEIVNIARHIVNNHTQTDIQYEFYKEKGKMFGFKMTATYTHTEATIMFEDESVLINTGHTWRVL